MPDSITSSFRREFAAPIETDRQVATITARDAISSSRRWRGMLVYVLSEELTYELSGGITNSDWREFGGGITEDAPEDGTPYVRQDGDWLSLTSATASVVFYIANNGGNWLTMKKYGSVSVSFEVGDQIIYRDATTQKRATYYVLDADLTLPADFSDRAKLDKYNESAPALI